MSRLPLLRPAALCLVAVGALLTPGCATKKHVRNTIEPVNRRVGELEAKTKKTDSDVSDIERNLSATDERAKGADAHAAEAAAAAAKANELAAQSGQQAETANRAAGDAKSQADAAHAKIAALSDKFEKTDNLELLAEENVLFKFNSATLTPEAKKKLEDALNKLNNQKRYVVEVQGYTDKSGSADYNLELSRKRADSVVHFLTVNNKVPLYRIFVQGVGVMDGNENLTGTRKEINEQSRRVEVKVYAPKLD